MSPGNFRRMTTVELLEWFAREAREGRHVNSIEATVSLLVRARRLTELLKKNEPGSFAYLELNRLNYPEDA